MRCHGCGLFFMLQSLWWINNIHSTSIDRSRASHREFQRWYSRGTLRQAGQTGTRYKRKRILFTPVMSWGSRNPGTLLRGSATDKPLTLVILKWCEGRECWHRNGETAHCITCLFLFCLWFQMPPGNSYQSHVCYYILSILLSILWCSNCSVCTHTYLSIYCYDRGAIHVP